MNRHQADELIMAALIQVKGIVQALPLADPDRHDVIRIEEEAESKSLMGLGRVLNTGVREVLECDWIYLALTDMDFDWGCRPSLVMKKGDEVVGEEVSNETTIERLKGDKNVWFMHKNFVVYKNKVSFPQDVMDKICHFEIPCHPADWCDVSQSTLRCHSIVYGSPSTPCDVFLKNQYFKGADTSGYGTILVGVKL